MSVYFVEQTQKYHDNDHWYNIDAYTSYSSYKEDIKKREVSSTKIIWRLFQRRKERNKLLKNIVTQQLRRSDVNIVFEKEKIIKSSLQLL